METKAKFGLIGRNISYSFSKKYFEQKFQKLLLNNHFYEILDFQNLDKISELLKTKNSGNPRELKSEIEKVVKANGCFILFTNKNLNTTLKEARIAKFREAIKDAGFPNHEFFEIEIYDSNSITDWVNKNMSSVILVQKMNDIHRIPFRNWDEWKATLKKSDIKLNLPINFLFKSSLSSPVSKKLELDASSKNLVFPINLTID